MAPADSARPTVPDAPEGPTAFHGIVSLGLRAVLAEHPQGAQVWHSHAHRLDRLDRSDPDLGWLARAADACGVLTHGQSTRAVHAYLAQRLGATATGRVRQLKEGHTSSVWLVEPSGASGPPAAPFVLNVARDAAAGADLTSTSRAMAELAVRSSGPDVAAVAEVVAFDLPGVAPGTDDVLPDAPPRDVVVARTAFVPDALEVHRWPGPARYVLVERFRTDPDQPALITGIRGRHVRPGEADAIDGCVAAVDEAAAPYGLAVDEGDLVWSRGRAVVVGLS